MNLEILNQTEIVHWKGTPVEPIGLKIDLPTDNNHHLDPLPHPHPHKLGIKIHINTVGHRLLLGNPHRTHRNFSIQSTYKTVNTERKINPRRVKRPEEDKLPTYIICSTIMYATFYDVIIQTLQSLLKRRIVTSQSPLLSSPTVEWILTDSIVLINHSRSPVISNTNSIIQTGYLAISSLQYMYVICFSPDGMKLALFISSHTLSWTPS